MATEHLMLSPLPRRHTVPATPRSFPTSPNYTPSEVEEKELCTPRPFWYDDDEKATQDLQDVFSYLYETPTPKSKLVPGWIPSFESRCLSSVSTTATSPAPPSCCSPPLSPDLADCSDGLESPLHAQQPPCPPGALDKSSWLQARKVFIGGIPQHIDQNDLYHMFSKHGKVKKAWLQLFHADRAAGQAKEKKHRGFGFVIFYEKQALDQLLGEANARFMIFPDNNNEMMKLEVKRAVGKNAQSPDAAPPAAKAKKLETPTSPPQQSLSPGLVTRDGPPQQSQAKNTPHGSSAFGQSKEPEICANGMSNSPQIWVLAAPQSWQRGPSPALMAGFQNYMNLPCVPPFPGVQSQQAQWPMTPVQPPRQTSASPAQSQGSSSQSSAFQTVAANTVLGEIVQGSPIQQLWRNLTPQELAQALDAAQPEAYED